MFFNIQNDFKIAPNYFVNLEIILLHNENLFTFPSNILKSPTITYLQLASRVNFKHSIDENLFFTSLGVWLTKGVHFL